jgi:hypothetical protein
MPMFFGYIAVVQAGRVKLITAVVTDSTAVKRLHRNLVAKLELGDAWPQGNNCPGILVPKNKFTVGPG